MSVTSVLTALPTSYSPLSGNNSQSAKYTAFAEQLQEDTAAKADGSPVTSGGTPDSAAMKDGQGTVEGADADAADVSRFQSTFAQARANGTTAGRSTSGTSGSGGSQSSSGIALYKRISQIGNNESSPSALLKSWNSIMQSGPDGSDAEAGAATLQAFLQSGTAAFGSGILDVTA